MASKATGRKLVYDFHEGNRDMKGLLGGKGANLAEMTNVGLPVPPGFTITTEACLSYLDHGTFPHGLMPEVDEHPDDGLARPVVRAAENARLEDSQGRQGPGGRRPHGGLRGRFPSSFPPCGRSDLRHWSPLHLDAAAPPPGRARSAGAAIRWRRRRSNR